ncbi:MAG: hypothetical protein NTX87_08155 [Planctomycetota bacterium]|nr:hypothetical protein [Planctomycetota bacterium]
MIKQLDGLRWKPAWISHLGCLAGCAAYLGVEVSRPWLYGATGHAFLINIHPEVCPSGPTCFKSEFIAQLAANAGLRVARGIVAHRSQPDFAARQEEAWTYVRGCIDRGDPCYAWEMKVPEWYAVYGYDDAGYYYSGAGRDKPSAATGWVRRGTTSGLKRLRAARPAASARGTTRPHGTSAAKWPYASCGRPGGASPARPMRRLTRPPVITTRLAMPLPPWPRSSPSRSATVARA